MPIPFLTTHWRNLLVATYSAPQALLAAQLPPAIELDLRDGQAFCSLVGFQFQSTSIFGIPSPFFNDFPEWNLRIYVRRGDKRGVCFVREFVPHRLVAWAGRLAFNEPFETAPVTAAVTIANDEFKADYTVGPGRSDAPAERDGRRADLAGDGRGCPFHGLVLGIRRVGRVPYRATGVGDSPAAEFRIRCRLGGALRSGVGRDERAGTVVRLLLARVAGESVHSFHSPSFCRICFAPSSPRCLRRT